MTRKMVIKVQMNCEKCRMRARKLVASAEGVESIAIEGEDKDHFVVIGEGVDFIRLTKTLRKKLGSANIVSIGEVEKSYKKEAKTQEPNIISKIQWHPHFYPSTQMVLYDEPYVVANPNPCCIL